MRDFIDEHRKILTIIVGILVFTIFITSGITLKKTEHYEEDTNVYEIDGEKVGTNEVYNDLVYYQQQSIYPNEIKALYNLCKDEVLNTIETTQTLTSEAKNLLGDYYTEDQEEQLIEDYKAKLLGINYIKEHIEELKPRAVYAILVNFEDTENPSTSPTTVEQEQMDDIDKKILLNGLDFKAASSQYGTNTLTDNGFVGVVDTNTDTNTINKTVLSTAMNLEEGNYSDWTRIDGYGYARVYVGETSEEDLEELYNGDDGFYDLVTTNDTKSIDEAIYEKINELKLSFKSKNVSLVLNKILSQEIDVNYDYNSYFEDNEFKDVIATINEKDITKEDIFNEMIFESGNTRDEFLRYSAMLKIASDEIGDTEDVLNMVEEKRTSFNEDYSTDIPSSYSNYYKRTIQLDCLYNQYIGEHIDEYTEDSSYLYFKCLQYGDNKSGATQAVDMFTGGSSYDEVISTFPPISTKEDCIVERKNNSINSYSLIVDTDMASEISGKTIEDGWFMTNCLGSYYLIQVKDTNSKDYKNVLCEYFSTDSSITEEIKDYYLDLHHFKSY